MSKEIKILGNDISFKIIIHLLNVRIGKLNHILE